VDHLVIETDGLSGGHKLSVGAAEYLARLASRELEPLYLGTPEEARRRHEATAAAAGIPAEVVRSVSDEVLGGVPTRSYQPHDPGNHAVTVFVHGGGWMTGSLDSYDRLCRSLANATNTTVVSVSYDLAPEAKHPTQIVQVLSVLSALQLRLRAPVAIVGDSAGAYLAAIATRCALKLGLSVVCQVLLYPVIDPALNTESAIRYARGFRLETETMRWYWEHYQPPGLVPPRVDDCALDITPPTLIVTAGFDPLHDEGVRFANTLAEAGVLTCLVDVTDQIHGFLRLDETETAATEVFLKVGAFVQKHCNPSAIATGDHLRGGDAGEVTH